MAPRGIVVISAPGDRAAAGAGAGCTLIAGDAAGVGDDAGGDGGGGVAGDGVAGVEPAAAPKRLGAGASGDGVLSVLGGAGDGGATSVGAGGGVCSAAGTAATRSGRLRSSVDT